MAHIHFVGGKNGRSHGAPMRFHVLERQRVRLWLKHAHNEIGTLHA